MADERYAEFIEETPKNWVQGLYEKSSTQKQRLGCIRKLSDGREFVYGRAGANLSAGFLVESPLADPTNLANLAVATNASAGDRKVQVTLGNSGAANSLNAFAEGWLYVNTGADAFGDLYKIKSHPAIAANANGWFDLYDKIRETLLAATHKVSLMKNEYAGVILDEANAAIVGAAFVDVAANDYAWFQKRGPIALSTNGTVVVGQRVYRSSGEVVPTSGNAADMAVQSYIGKVIQVNSNDHASLIFLEL